MSPLQLWLIAIGAAVLVAVVIYNAWSGRRSAPRRAQAEVAASTATGPEPQGEAVFPPGPAERVEPVLDVEGRLVAEPPEPERKAVLDALIDALAPIALDGRQVSGEALLAALPSTRRVGSKPFGVEALPEGGGDWEYPLPGGRYGAVQVGVQLANRTGALNEIEFSEFVGVAQRYADAIDGEPDFPDMLAEVARAREMDQFASRHDAQLGLSLRARGAAWSAGFVAQQAARLGFVAGAVPGRMVLPASQAGRPSILSLASPVAAFAVDQAEPPAVREITLHLDVPQVARSERPFERLREAMAQLAQAMDGVIVDDAGQALGAASLDAIGADLERLYDTLEQRDLAAGSPQARRLFS